MIVDFPQRNSLEEPADDWNGHAGPGLSGRLPLVPLLGARQVILQQYKKFYLFITVNSRVLIGRKMSESVLYKNLLAYERFELES